MSQTALGHFKITGLRRAATLGAVVFAAAVYEINMTNATVVLPHMQGSFSATKDQVSWTITAFIVGMIMGFAASGWCADRFGGRRLFLICLLAYTVASLFCGLAVTLEEEVAWRFVQGAVGAPMMPISLAIVLDSFPRRQHGTANAIWGIGITTGPVAGPVVGGYIAEFNHWSWVFHFNIPLGLISFVACFLLIPPVVGDRGRRLDWFGFACLLVTVGALQLMLNRGERLAWFESTEIVIEAALSVIALYLFVVHVLTTREPFVRLAIFLDRNVVLGLMIAMLWGFMLHGVLVLLSLMMQELRGYPVMTVGTVLAPRGLAIMVGSILASRLVQRFDPRHIMLFALFCMTISSWVMAQWTLEVTAWEVTWTGAVQGFATGLGFVTLTVKTFSTLDRRYRAESITFYNLMNFMGTGAGIAFAMTMVTRTTSAARAALVEGLTPFNELFRYFSIPEVWDLSSAAGRAAIEVEVMRQATMVGYLNYFFLMAVMAVVTAPLVFLFSPGRIDADELPHED